MAIGQRREPPAKEEVADLNHIRDLRRRVVVWFWTWPIVALALIAPVVFGLGPLGLPEPYVFGISVVLLLAVAACTAYRQASLLFMRCPRCKGRWADPWNGFSIFRKACRQCGATWETGE
ncbi:MAG: hypothetical protein IT450_23175 [Phycisphaerales bacterium]|nr:hypothetical protein [Phycisphaerales bacterium]